MSALPYLALISALAALGVAFFYFRAVEASSPGNDRMVFLMEEIQKGARAFLKKEYTWVSAFVVVMLVLIGAVIHPLAAVSYLLGALLSGTAGYVGMTVATMANARTTEAAKSGPAKALAVAFRGGAVMGFTVAGLALVGLMTVYIVFVTLLEHNEAFEIVTAYGLGASSIALFSRVGGGIYTKAADIGADLVGKVEAGIPEDDPRNPATIADLVGDNVGDVAGMGADLFESYAGSIIAPISLVAFGIAGVGISAEQAGDSGTIQFLMFPIAVAFVGMVASIIGSFFVKSGDSTDSKSLSRALHRGTNVAMGLTLIATVVVAYWLFDGTDKPWGLAVSVIGGLFAGWALGKTAEYYTSDHFGPVKKIARQTETGPATTILGGISAGMISVAASVSIVVLGVAVAFWGGEQTLGDGSFAGIYGIAVAAIGMLATTAIVVSVDAYGPIADNAGGIAELAELDPSVREVTDALDSLGNTTAAVAKGFAVGSAALTALALFKSFEFALLREGRVLSLDVGQVDVFIGLFLGAALPFLFAALTIDAVGRAAHSMIEEVRRQFREIPGLREGKEGVIPDSARCVEISTDASLREMIIPGALAVVVPLVVGFIDVDTLGGLLAGALVTGFALAIFMANAGGAWDNAKKYIEAGAHGGKGSEQHKAAVISDTVGDPFKDTSGPAMNILIKVMTIVSLVFASAFV